MEAGEEGTRTKRGIGDSYNAPPAINQLDWKRIYRYNDLVDYYAGLIALPEGSWQVITEGTHFERDSDGRLQPLKATAQRVCAAAMSVTILGR